MTVVLYVCVLATAGSILNKSYTISNLSFCSVGSVVDGSLLTGLWDNSARKITLRAAEIGTNTSVARHTVITVCVRYFHAMYGNLSGYQNHTVILKTEPKFDKL